MSNSDRLVGAYAIVPFVVATAAAGLVVIDPFRLAAGLVRYGGLGVVAVGVGLVGWTVWTVGQTEETLSPVTTPDRLVATGAFAYTRNPMYLGVLAVATGVAVVGSSPVAGGYAVLLAAVYHTIVVFVEEPGLRDTFSSEYDRYCERVPRWVPQVRQS